MLSFFLNVGDGAWKKGDYYRLYSAATLHQIKALALQEPATSRVVPYVNYVHIL